jgi:hypothetical protein
VAYGTTQAEGLEQQGAALRSRLLYRTRGQGSRASGTTPGILSTMAREQLRTTVDQLRDELRSGEPLDPGERDLLERTLAEVGGLLDSEAALSGEHGLVGSLRDAAQRFEESHPKLTLAIGAVADSLTRVGL